MKRSGIINTLLVLGSIFMTFLLLEGTLTLAGKLQLYQQHIGNRLGLHREYRIMCVGESTTYVGGEGAYPAQLERVLNEQAGGRNFKVINKGVPGINTDYIAEHLPRWIDEFRPGIVVVMMGVNDSRDVLPYSPQGPWYQRLHVYKLFSLCRAHVQAKFFSEKKPASSAPDAEEGMDYWTEARQKMVRVPALRSLYTASLYAEKNGDLATAEKALVAICRLSLDPVVVRYAEEERGHLLLRHGRYEELIDYIYSSLLGHADIAQLLVWIGDMTLRRIAPERLIVVLRALSGRAPDLYRLEDLLAENYSLIGDEVPALLHRKKADGLRMQEMSAGTRQNFRRVIDIMRERDVTGVLMQYPLRDVKSLKEFVNMPESSAGRIIFVENKDNFSSAIARDGKEAYFYDIFAGDFGHCTQKGNELIARNLARVILEITGKK